MFFSRATRVATIGVVSLCASWLLAAPKPTPKSSGSPATQASEPSFPVQSRPEYVLQPLDLIKMEVFQEPDMERQVRLSQDSTVTLPMINTVSLKGKTLQEAQETIRQLYDRDYLVNPQINLTVLEYAKHDVKVLGQVDKAGAIEIPADKPLKLLDAIALAGGFTRLADRRHVTLTRTNEDGKPTTTEINVDDIIQSKTSSDTWLLREGDVIYVPERIL